MKPGPQPPACCVQDCAHPPVEIGGYCDGHKQYFAKQNGTALTPAILEPDDPHLLERAARTAAAQEAKEYAERRRVRTWKTMENGSRVPETYYTDAELAEIDAAAERTVIDMSARTVATHLPVSRDMLAEAAYLALSPPPPEDPEKAALKLLKRALRGKMGEAAGRAAWGLVDMLRGDR